MCIVRVICKYLVAVSNAPGHFRLYSPMPATASCSTNTCKAVEQVWEQCSTTPVQFQLVILQDTDSAKPGAVKVNIDDLFLSFNLRHQVESA